jgi:hypothetical protein
MLLAMGCTWQAVGAAATAEQAGSAPAATPMYPGFSVNVTLSDKAMAKMVAGKETVIVAGYLTGNPKPGAVKKYVDEMGEVGLGTIQMEVGPGVIAHFGPTTLMQDAFAQTDKKDAQLLINVYSGRKSSPDNLLDCGIYEGPLKPVQGTTIPIACKLIGE